MDRQYKEATRRQVFYSALYSSTSKEQLVSGEQVQGQGPDSQWANEGSWNGTN
jgi:hypothetical protein